MFDIVRYSHILSDIVKYSLILFLILFYIFKCGQNELYQILLSNVRHYQIIYMNINPIRPRWGHNVPTGSKLVQNLQNENSDGPNTGL